MNPVQKSMFKNAITYSSISGSDGQLGLDLGTLILKGKLPRRKKFILMRKEMGVTVVQVLSP